MRKRVIKGIVQAVLAVIGVLGAHNLAAAPEVWLDALGPGPGPGNIDQAHTIGEWIAVEQLHGTVGVYTRLIEDLCA